VKKKLKKKKKKKKEKENNNISVELTAGSTLQLLYTHCEASLSFSSSVGRKTLSVNHFVRKRNSLERSDDAKSFRQLL
jgi:hypothetical protein